MGSESTSGRHLPHLHTEAMKAYIFSTVLLALCSSSPSPFKVFQRHSMPETSLLPRVGRNSKVMVIANEDSKDKDKEEHLGQMNIEEMLKDLEQKLAEVKRMESIDLENTQRVTKGKGRKKCELDG